MHVMQRCARITFQVRRAAGVRLPRTADFDWRVGLPPAASRRVGSRAGWGRGQEAQPPTNNNYQSSPFTRSLHAAAGRGEPTPYVTLTHFRSHYMSATQHRQTAANYCSLQFTNCFLLRGDAIVVYLLVRFPCRVAEQHEPPSLGCPLPRHQQAPRRESVSTGYSQPVTDNLKFKFSIFVDALIISLAKTE
ncbi:hypothetical protein HW555_000857 [Spodoptera exigua]|uniref:Uncharacterized protein n=1 Tax=Spodoptera exigua TaxID=7107 RepID=A0A835GRF5_SPOEX|nr:hypothetical protein HW555_000857 [Spodoptera exigua]